MPTQMGLGKTITCVSLIAATFSAANEFGASPLEHQHRPNLHAQTDAPALTDFSSSVFGMPDPDSRGKAKMSKLQDKLLADWVRRSQIQVKSRATLIVCPLSTISNWEDQFREHWQGQVTIIGGSGGTLTPSVPPVSSQLISMNDTADVKPTPVLPLRREGQPLKVYIYHGNTRRLEPRYLANFDVVITTFSTLASEFSKQTKSARPDEDEGDSSDDIVAVDGEMPGTHTIKMAKPKKNLKRKKTVNGTATPTACSALQAVHWFRVVLDEAQ
jgi:SNF2 family DNA or RNA helicase